MTVRSIPYLRDETNAAGPSAVDAHTTGSESERLTNGPQPSSAKCLKCQREDAVDSGFCGECADEIRMDNDLADCAPELGLHGRINYGCDVDPWGRA